MPKSTDTITQADLAAAVVAHRLTNTLMYRLRQRVLHGANVEPGQYSISPRGDNTLPAEFNGFDQLETSINIDRNIPEIFT
jgi:hypothetical protein